MGDSHSEHRLSIPDSVPVARPLEGTTEYGAFETHEVVGTGGNATVYAASVRNDPERIVALKEPHVPEKSSSTTTDRFRTEAETWGGIDSHDNIVSVYAWDTDPFPWIALEFMDAGNLADRTDDCRVNHDDCRVNHGLWIGTRIAAAIEHAHRNGVAHLDLKPENVLFRESSDAAWAVPKVADWGMAAFLREETVNLEGLSPRYAAPEQFAPDRYDLPGVRTDVYQLGVVLYELLVGSPPFDGPPRLLRDAILDETPPPPSGRNPDLPSAIDDVLDRGLAKNPADRYDSMDTFRRELERLLAERTEYEPDSDLAERTESDSQDVALESRPGRTVEADSAESGTTNPYERALTLADEGFVQLSDQYFARRTSASQLEAWRRGVTLADAHAGRAVERTVPDDGDDPMDSDDGDDSTERTRLTDRLLEGLSAGVDHVVLGSPGSGKSTVCKQVACEWFDRGYGPAFYRESGQSNWFERSDALARRVTDTDGHVLVVVEDAVRPEANSVFEFLDRVADSEEVTLLLDAREGEWREASSKTDEFGTDPVATARRTLEPVYVPRPDAHERERFVCRVETATDRLLDLDVEQLQRGTGRSSRSDADETQPGELFYLLHRLTALARDPLSATDVPTSLTDAVADTYDRLADVGDGTLDTGICANLLNAAGVGVHPGLLYAVAPDNPLGVDDAIDVLEGRVLFPTETDWDAGTSAYPAIHEAWSAEFLAHCLDAEGEDAARVRFGRVLNRVVSLADDADRCEEIAGTLRVEAPQLARVETDPEAWANETVEQFVELAETYPRLAPLFGTTETAAYELPDACSAERRRTVLLTRADAHCDCCAYDRARAEYETALDRARAAEDRPRVAASLDGLGTVARLQNEYDEARDRYRQSLAIAREIGERRREAEALTQLGTNATSRSEYATGRRYVEQGLDIYRELDDRLGMARCLQTLGRAAYRQGEYEEAREYLRQSLDNKSELGDRPGVARSLNRLGTTAQIQGDYEEAREYLRRSLELWRDLDNRQHAAGAVHNLGIVAEDLGEYDRARDHYRQSLDTFQDLDAPDGKALNFNRLGRVSEQQGEYEEAREYHRRSLDIWRELDDRHGVARALQDIGSTVRELGEYEEARDHLDRAVELYRDVGDATGEGEALRKLGTLVRRQGDQDEARERYESARRLFEQTGSTQLELGVLEALVEIERDAGRHDRARDYCETARQRLTETDLPDARREAIESLCDGGPEPAR